MDPIEREACVCGEGGVIVNSPPWEEPREALAYQGTPYSLPPQPRTPYSYSYTSFLSNTTVLCKPITRSDLLRRLHDANEEKINQRNPYRLDVCLKGVDIKIQHRCLLKTQKLKFALP